MIHRNLFNISYEGSLNNNSTRLPLSHQIFCRLKQMIEIQTSSQEW